MRAETESADLADVAVESAVDSATGSSTPSGGLPDFDRRQRAALRVLGRGLMTAGQYAQARAVFTALLHLDPTHTGDLAAAAEAFQAEGQPAQAASLLQVCLLLGSAEADVALRLAECHVALGNASAAQVALDVAEECATKVHDAAILARVAIMRNGMAA